MPIIIDEIVISVDVDNTVSGGAASPSVADDRQTIVAECVERVLEVLRQREER